MTRSLSPDEERLWRALTEVLAPPEGRRVVRPEEQRLWLAATGQAAPTPPAAPAPAPPPRKAAVAPVAAAPAAPRAAAPRPYQPPEGIEPGRKRRLVRERDPIDARIDLHGLDQDRARLALERFIAWAFSQRYRAVLVITGKGTRGDGVLRRMTPEWLAEPQLRAMIAGFSRADRRHGGEGALYVALKRAPSA